MGDWNRTYRLARTAGVLKQWTYLTIFIPCSIKKVKCNLIIVENKGLAEHGLNRLVHLKNTMVKY
jgi:hypothetical protein